MLLSLDCIISLQSSLTLLFCSFFFFNDTATTEIYTLSLHDALPISSRRGRGRRPGGLARGVPARSLPHPWPPGRRDRKSTRLNSSHQIISYAVFCLKKKKNKNLVCIFNNLTHLISQHQMHRVHSRPV